jgi:hypothetical protein
MTYGALLSQFDKYTPKALKRLKLTDMPIL